MCLIKCNISIILLSLVVFSFHSISSEGNPDFTIEARSSDSDQAALEVNAGIIALNDRMYDEAIGHFLNALEYGFDKYRIEYMIGVVLLEQGEIDEAIVKLSKALIQYPNWIDAHYQLGTAYMRKQQYDMAVSSYQAAININSEIPIILSAFAMALDLNGSKEKALEYYTKVIEIDSENPKHYLDRAYLLFSLDELENSLKDLNLAISIDKNYGDAWGMLSQLYFRQGKESEGCETATQACQLGSCWAIDKFGPLKCKTNQDAHSNGSRHN